VAKPSMSSLQSGVALAAGLTSIVGAGYSAIGTFHATPATGELVAVVRDAGTAQPVPGAVVEVLTPENEIVTTMPHGTDGLARRALAPGSYRVRVMHPEFAEAQRDVKIAPDQVAEVRVLLVHRSTPSASRQAARAAPGHQGASPIDEAGAAIDRGMNAGRRVLSRIGF